MRYTITWLPEENSFRICREDGEVAYVQTPIFHQLASNATALRSTVQQAMRHPDKAVRFECGEPAECAENYQRSLVRAGSEDAAMTRLPKD